MFLSEQFRNLKLFGTLDNQSINFCDFQYHVAPIDVNINNVIHLELSHLTTNFELINHDDTSDEYSTMIHFNSKYFHQKNFCLIEKLKKIHYKKYHIIRDEVLKSLQNEFKNLYPPKDHQN